MKTQTVIDRPGAPIEKWWGPDYDSESVRYAVNEWQKKANYILSLVDKKRTVIQAGGNVGVFPKRLAQHFMSVYTFEPVRFNYECLLKNIEGIYNIVPYNKGLSDKEQNTHIKWKHENNCGAVRLSEDDDGDIKLITLDSIEIIDVDMIWLDVEGFEYKALQGAKQTIEKYRPVIILENNGLIHGYPEQQKGMGSSEFRSVMLEEFNYKLDKTMMRDDIYIYAN